MRWLPSATLGLCACAPDTIVLEPALQPAELAEVCGQPGPFRLLPFAPDQAPPNLRTAVSRIGDRIYFVIGRGAGTDGFPVESTVTSTGPCGEDPRVIATDLSRVYEDERWPGLVLGYGIDESVVVLDPEGVVPPRTLVSSVDFYGGWSAHGSVASHGYPRGPERPPDPHVDDWRVDLRLTPYPAGPDEIPAPIVLIQGDFFFGEFDVREHDVFFVNQVGELWNVSLPEGKTTLERENVESFKVSVDGRFVVWWPPGFGFGRTVELYDRQTGESRALGPVFGFVELSRDHFVFTPAGPEPPASRMIRLPDLETTDGPPFVELEFAVDDTRWIGHRRPEDTFVLFDTTTGETTTLLPHTDEPIRHPLEDPERLEVFLEDEDDRGSLHAAWFDGRPPRQLATRSSADHHHVPGDRIVTPIPSDDGDVTVLALTDGDGTTRWFIDTHVVPIIGRLQQGAGYDHDEVIYAVQDGERSGMWLARLAPPR